jgi:hypothetical protein
MGFIQRSPLRRHAQLASTPRQTEVCPSSKGCHAFRTFRPCRSTRLRRFTPLAAQQVYCTLQPTMRFATFPNHPKTTLPQWRRPFEAFPFLTAAICRHTAYLRAVGPTPALRCRSLRIGSRPQGVEQARKSVARSLCFHKPRLDAPMGFKPNPHAICIRRNSDLKPHRSRASSPVYHHGCPRRAHWFPKKPTRKHRSQPPHPEEQNGSIRRKPEDSRLI